MFALAMLSVEFKLAIDALGIGSVDVRSLVAALSKVSNSGLQDMVFVQAVG